MHCEKCGWNIDRIDNDDFYCGTCGAKLVIHELQTPTLLLDLVVVLNYIAICFAAFVLMFLFALTPIYNWSSLWGVSILFVIMAGIILWSNAGLKKFNSFRRIFPVSIYVLLSLFYIVILVGSWMLSIAALLNIYVLYVHKPTVELFRQIK